MPNSSRIMKQHLSYSPLKVGAHTNWYRSSFLVIVSQMPKTLLFIKLSPTAQIPKIVGVGYLVGFPPVSHRMIHARKHIIKRIPATIQAVLSRLATRLMT